MKLPGFFKSTFFKLSVTLSGFIMICLMVNANETLFDKAKRISFPGKTHIKMNYTLKNLDLEKRTLNIDSALIKDLNTHQLKVISAVYEDKKNNLMVAMTQSADERVLFTVIKNSKVIQVQKVNEITNRDISLQYGKITLNTEKPLVATNAASDLF